MHALGRARIRARSLTILFAALLAVGAAGCSAAGSSSVKASGKTLTIYASAPAGSDGQDVYDAEQLAFTKLHSEVTAFKVALKQLTAPKLSDRARTAIADSGAIAYIGEIAPGASADTVGITNAEDLLQVSPTDTALELTQATAAVPGAPGSYYESLKSYGQTFARVVPSTAAEARALVQEMGSLGVKQLFVADDGSPYGKAIAAAVKKDAPPAITVASSAQGADAVFFGGIDAAAAGRTFKSVGPNVKLFGPSALDTSAFASSAAGSVYVSVPGLTSGSLPASGQTFVSDFTAKYGHAPSPSAIFGYEAMAAVLDVIKQAGSTANDRSVIVHNFLALKNRNSVLGTYSMNPKGDTSLAPFVFSRLRAGKLVPVK